MGADATLLINLYNWTFQRKCNSIKLMLWYCLYSKISTSRHREKNNFQMKEIFWLKCKLSRHSPIPRKTFQLILRLNQRLIAGLLWNIISKHFQYKNSRKFLPSEPSQHSWNINFVSTQSVGERGWLEMLTENILPN